MKAAFSRLSEVEETKSIDDFSPAVSRMVRLSWGQAVVVLLVLLSIAAMIFFGFRAFDSAMECVRRQFNQQQLILARSASSAIETVISDFAVHLNQMAEMASDSEDLSQMSAGIRRMYFGVPGITSMRKLDSRGRLSFIVPDNGRRGDLAGKDYSRTDYFIKASGTDRIVCSGVLNEKGNRRVRLAKAMFAAGPKGEKIFNGVMVLSCNPDTLFEKYLAIIRSGQKGHAWIVNRTGSVLWHLNPKLKGRNVTALDGSPVDPSAVNPFHSMIQEMLSGREGMGCAVLKSDSVPGGRAKHLIAYAPVHMHDLVWSVALSAPTDEAERILIATHTNMVVVYGIIFFMLSGGVCIYFLKSHSCKKILKQEVCKQTAELRETRDYLHRLITCSNSPIVVTGPDRIIQLVNISFENLCGLNRHELIGRGVETISTDFFEAFRDGVAQTHNNSQDIRTFEVTIYRKNGTLRTGLWTFANIYKQDGNTLMAVVAQGQDITQRKLAEKKLQESEERYRTLFENAPFAYFSLGIANAAIRVGNNAAVGLYGYDPDTLSRMHFADLFFDKPDGVSTVRRILRECWEDIPVQDIEVKMRRKNGQGFWSCVTVVPVRNEQKILTEILVMVMDISDRKRMEKQLYQAQKMQSLGTLAAGVAHEINNPVHLILLNTPLIMKIWEDIRPLIASRSTEVPESTTYGGLTAKFVNEHMGQLMADVDLAARHISKIIDDMKRFSKQPDVMDMKKGSIHEALRNALRLIRPSLKKNDVTLDVRLCADMPLISCNLHAVEELILNLVLNAVQALGKSGGRVVVSTGVDQDCGVFIQVADDGPGIPREIIGNIFDPFATSRHSEGGTGLGLSIAYNLVQAHKGYIDFESEPETGTQFTVWLPTDTRDQRCKILVVDDDVMIRDLLNAVLEKEGGFKVVTASNGVEACIKLGSFSPDLVILDLFMPEMDGLEVCREISRQPSLAGMKVIITTAMPHDVKITEAGKLGFSQICPKPIDIGRMLGMIYHILDMKQGTEE